ncbi:hypothetical protein [Burkholderia sp. Ac-20365]|uniref:hypothetical protein n=1 Tax=Burkholderia sp. Ac-20365 TaxID=2703897 RepID=UPI00197BE6E4|nr:hypothetical protein [Burkholderia sp. Ac-20365]MBN3761224.1 hypothetical protein [Burkholderia sp. Ac-20365]
MSNVAHEGKVVDVGIPQEGSIELFYAHGSDSLRTYLGKSKFHANADCRALLSGNAAKTLIREWMTDVPDRSLCRVCAPKATSVDAAT